MSAPVIQIVAVNSMIVTKMVVWFVLRDVENILKNAIAVQPVSPRTMLETALNAARYVTPAGYAIAKSSTNTLDDCVRIEFPAEFQTFALFLSLFLFFIV